MRWGWGADETPPPPFPAVVGKSPTSSCLPHSAPGRWWRQDAPVQKTTQELVSVTSPWVGSERCLFSGLLQIRWTPNHPYLCLPPDPASEAGKNQHGRRKGIILDSQEATETGASRPPTPISLGSLGRQAVPIPGSDSSHCCLSSQTFLGNFSPLRREEAGTVKGKQNISKSHP